MTLKTYTLENGIVWQYERAELQATFGTVYASRSSETGLKWGAPNVVRGLYETTAELLAACETAFYAPEPIIIENYGAHYQAQYDHACGYYD